MEMDLETVDHDNELIEANEHECQGFDLDPKIEKMATGEATNSCSMNTQGSGYDNDLYSKFQMLIGHQRCSPDQPQPTTHISDIPPEIVLYILKLMTNHATDKFKILNVCASVCRSWYLYARNPLIYRQACSELWTEKEEDLKKYGGSWRQMYLKRPHVFTHGCYIASLDVFENLFGYRYCALKFFPDGRVISLVTYNKPNDMLWKIKILVDQVYVIPCGHYEFKENKLVLTFNGEHSWRDLSNYPSDSFELDEFAHDSHHADCLVFEIAEHNSKRFCKLLNVRIQSIRRNGISIDVSSSSLPPFIHSL